MAVGQSGQSDDLEKTRRIPAIVNIAKENNITVLAEGIETKEEYLYLKENGASLVQGYYFAKPSSEPIRKINF